MARIWPAVDGANKAKAPSMPSTYDGDNSSIGPSDNNGDDGGSGLPMADDYNVFYRYIH
jgi:hypothetical protein